MIRTNVYIPEQQFDAMKKLSKETGISFSEHIRRAVSQYLDVVSTKTRYVVREVPLNYTATSK